MISTLVLPATPASFRAFARANLYSDVAQVALAIRRYRDAKKQLPESLEELVPEYLEQIPHDPYDGRPIRYRRVSELETHFYSVGLDLKDDGGVLDTDSTQGPYRVLIHNDDVIIRMLWPE